MTITTIAFLNNDISAALAERDLIARGIPLCQVVVILGRDLVQPWLEECAAVCRYGSKASLSLIGQAKFIRFYREAAALIRRVRRAGFLREIYVVNNDNLLTSHLLALAASSPLLTVTVVAEGLMNYQEITVDNRVTWRWRVKPPIAFLLGLDYRKPHGHLSGAFEPMVNRVISFATPGLKAPPEKVVVHPLTPVIIHAPTDPRVALLVHTALWQWMSAEDYLRFAEGFAVWVKAQNFAKLYVKPHPRYATGVIADLLPPHQVITDPRAVEELAGEIDAGTVLGTCCTALATLKLIRPDLDCVDWGADYYLPRAYRGDRSVLELFGAVGVRSIPFSGTES